MKEAIEFYTKILDFKMKESGDSADYWVVILGEGDAELMLSTIDGLMGNVANVLVDNVDDLFKKYIQRGLDVSAKKDSPVHQEPVNQTWGTRDFYVTDADGNTLRFNQPIQ